MLGVLILLHAFHILQAAALSKGDEKSITQAVSRFSAAGPALPGAPGCVPAVLRAAWCPVSCSQSLCLSRSNRVGRQICRQKRVVLKSAPWVGWGFSAPQFPLTHSCQLSGPQCLGPQWAVITSHPSSSRSPHENLSFRSLGKVPNSE